MVRLPPLLAETNAFATWFVPLIYFVAAGPVRVEFYYYHNKMALFTNAKKTQHKIFSNSLFYLDTVLTQSLDHYSVWLYTFHINLQIVRWGRRNSPLWAKIRNFGCEVVIKKADQKNRYRIDIDDISQISIEIDRKFLGAYRPITTSTTDRQQIPTIG